MHAFQEALPGSFELALARLEESLYTRQVGNLAGSQVPLPGTDVSDLKSHGQLILALAQRFLGVGHSLPELG